MGKTTTNSDTQPRKENIIRRLNGRARLRRAQTNPHNIHQPKAGTWTHYDARSPFPGPRLCSAQAESVAARGKQTSRQNSHRRLPSHPLRLVLRGHSRGPLERGAPVSDPARQSLPPQSALAIRLTPFPSKSHLSSSHRRTSLPSKGNPCQTRHLRYRPSRSSSPFIWIAWLIKAKAVSPPEAGLWGLLK